MAKMGEMPTLNPLQGREALERDLPPVLAALGFRTLEDAGWELTPDKLSLLVPVDGRVGERTDHYLLKLGFHAYRTWPPSAQFVNPATKGYRYPDDVEHLPVLGSPEVHVHPNYQSSGGTLQLICCSATLEFYQVLHGVEEKHVWDENRFTFLTTIAAIKAAMQSSHYTGRQPKHG